MPTLSFFEEKDFNQLIQWINTEELLMNWSGRMFAFPLTKDSLAWYLNDTNVVGISDAFIFKAIDDNGTVVGHISLGNVSTTNKSARISRVFVSNEGRNKGICTFMVQEVLKFGFQQLHLHRIALGVYTNNQSAVACYKKAGLQIEGIHKDVLLHYNQYWSSIEMAILDTEWLEINSYNF